MLNNANFMKKDIVVLYLKYPKYPNFYSHHSIKHNAMKNAYVNQDFQEMVDRILRLLDSR